MKKQISIDYGKLRQELTKVAEKYHGHHEWTREEDDLLREFYGKVSTRLLCNKLNVTDHQLYNRATKLNLSHNRA